MPISTSEPLASLAPQSIGAPGLTETTDAAAGTGTAYTIGLGDIFQGTIASASDNDWIRITLEAGQNYVMQAWGTGSGLGDTELRLYNSSGQQLAFNDDAASDNNFSLIDFTASSTGTYYLGVSGHQSATGSYRATIATDVFTVEQVATQMTEIAWGVPVALAFDAQSGDTLTVNLTGLTAAGRQLAQWALEAWSMATGLIFQQSTSQNAHLMFDDNQVGGFGGPNAYYPSTGEILQGTVNVSSAWLASYGTTIDSFSMSAYLHEIGHALGLGHPGHYDGSAAYGTDNIYLNDSTQMTVMSYFSPSENDYIGGSHADPVTLMLADIMAIQAIYGSPTSIQGGNTVWGANSNVGGYLGTLFAQIFDDVAANSSVYAGHGVMLTVLDTGGHDLLDLSTLWQDAHVDLTPGGIGNFGGEIGNLAIDVNTVIEDVATGSGDDTIIGNAADNEITAGAGNDTVDGGGGNDTAVLAVSRGSITASAEGAALRIVSSLGTDTYINVEWFRFTDGTVSAADLLTGPSVPGFQFLGTPSDDSLTGSIGDDMMTGGSGNDLMMGDDGNDEMYGGLGFDEMYGGDGHDVMRGLNGFDSLYGGAGNDDMNGNFGNDRLEGGAGNDTLNGGMGRDTIYGGSGDDLLIGLEGFDTLHGDAGNDTLRGNAGFDVLYGGTGDDMLYGGIANDLLEGGDGADTLYGDAGSDQLFGGDGADRLYGNAGSDWLEGGAGNDTLIGGQGADSFVFMLGSGQTRVLDMGLADTLLFDANLLAGSGASVDDLRTYATVGSGGVVFDFGNGDILTITNTQNLDMLIGHAELI